MAATRTDSPSARGRSGGWRGALRLLAGLAVVAGLVVLPGTAMASVLQTSQVDDRDSADALVVLGSATRDGRPGAVFEARLDHARDLYAEGVAPEIVTVGGLGFRDAATEADVGARWLVDRGVPADAVVPLGVGDDTFTSLQAVAGEWRARGWDSVVLVTDPWHSYRSQAMAEDLGIPHVGVSPATSGPNVESDRRAAFFVVRETAAVLEYRTLSLTREAGPAAAVATGDVDAA